MILRAKVLRLEREAREGEKASEALRHAQAQNEENQKAKKRLTSQSQNAKLEIASLKEVCLFVCLFVCCLFVCLFIQ